jgi:hypothetical protein
VTCKFRLWGVRGIDPGRGCWVALRLTQLGRYSKRNRSISKSYEGKCCVSKGAELDTDYVHDSPVVIFEHHMSVVLIF